jgi:hypothetical protein
VTLPDADGETPELADASTLLALERVHATSKVAVLRRRARGYVMRRKG